MPNRIIKESICTSDTVNRLSLFEEVFFYRLIVSCDDYGRCDARPAILKGRMFPLRDVRNEQISDALSKLALEKLAILYEVDGKPFVQLSGWAEHQRVRNTVKKYPDPPQPAATCGNLRQTAANRGQNPESRILYPNPESNPNPTRATDEPPPFISQEEADALQADIDTIRREAQRCGLPITDKGMDDALSLKDAHGLDKLLEAINKAGEQPKDKWHWRYVAGILKDKPPVDDGKW